MIVRVMAALAVAASMTVGAGLSAAYEFKVMNPAATANAIGAAVDFIHDPDANGETAGGDDVELEGTLEVLVEDRPEGAQYRHFLSTHGGKRWSLEGVPQGHDLLTGDRVRVRGVPTDKAIRLRTARSTEPGLPATGATGSGGMALQVLALAPLSNTFGVQKTAVLLVNFLNDPSQPTTIARMQTVMAATDDFFRENSYQQTSLDVDVFGWYALPMPNTGCPTSTIKSYADQAATAAGVDRTPYARRIYVFPSTTQCPWAGVSTVGGNPSNSWINGQADNFLVINHELGHGFGLYHSHGLRCQPGAVGTSCSSVEYGDFADTMGNTYGHFNAFQKSRLGWLDYGASPPVSTVPTSGAYTIDAYEAPGAGPKALKIPRGTTGQAFFVELRRSTGFDVYPTGPGCSSTWRRTALPTAAICST
jgi:M6 family metalloprotease-like protein